MQDKAELGGWADNFLAGHKLGYQLVQGLPEHSSQEGLAAGCVLAASMTALGSSHTHRRGQSAAGEPPRLASAQGRKLFPAPADSALSLHAERLHAGTL